MSSLGELFRTDSPNVWGGGGSEGWRGVTKAIPLHEGGEKGGGGSF
jgi:hypothetical protein